MHPFAQYIERYRDGHHGVQPEPAGEQYQRDPDHFRAGYDDLLSRAGMNTAEELGAAFGIDVTDEAFWTASLDVLRARMSEYSRLAAEIS